MAFALDVGKTIGIGPASTNFGGCQMDQISSTTGTRITQHAWNRMNARRLSNDAINAALTYGRVVHVRGAAIHVIGRKEVERLSRAGLDLEAY